MILNKSIMNIFQRNTGFTAKSGKFSSPYECGLKGTAKHVHKFIGIHRIEGKGAVFDEDTLNEITDGALKAKKDFNRAEAFQKLAQELPSEVFTSARMFFTLSTEDIETALEGMDEDKKQTRLNEWLIDTIKADTAERHPKPTGDNIVTALIYAGADMHVNNEEPLRIAAMKEDSFDTINLCVHGADIQSALDYIQSKERKSIAHVRAEKRLHTYKQALSGSFRSDTETSTKPLTEKPETPEEKIERLQTTVEKLSREVSNMKKQAKPLPIKTRPTVNP